MSPEPDHGKPRNWRAIIASMARRIEAEDYPSGDLAQLRRLEPDTPDGKAFWILVVHHVPEALDDERLLFALAVVLRGMGIACPFHRPPEGERRSLGFALAEARVSEQRLLRLLRLDPERLAVELRQLAQLVRNKGDDARFDWSDAFWLVLLDPDHEGGRRHRRRIARDYYARILSREKEKEAA